MALSLNRVLVHQRNSPYSTRPLIPWGLTVPVVRQIENVVSSSRYLHRHLVGAHETLCGRDFEKWPDAKTREPAKFCMHCGRIEERWYMPVPR